LIDRLIDHCQRRETMMVADSQASSQIGDVSRFKGMSLLTPTGHEARLAIRDYSSGFVVLAENLRRKANAEQLFITLDAEGMLIHARVDANIWQAAYLGSVAAACQVSRVGHSPLSAEELHVELSL
jgi:bifunctional ADP-heptose synthase (sugar kinase/adenylyltransferase)